MFQLSLNDAYQAALQHHQAGRFAEAEALYQQILAADSNQPDALHLLGVIAGQSGRLEAAVEQIQRAVALRPTDASFHNNLGRFLADQGHFAEAIAACRQALQIRPEYALASFNLANALSANQQFDEAIIAYRRALQLQPDYVEAYNNLACALRATGQLKVAADACRAALRFNPKSPEIHTNLGNALKEQGLLDEAIASYRRALQLRPDDANAQCNLASALTAKGQFDEAITACRRALELQPDHVDTLNNLGVALKAAGQLDDALASYRRAMQIKPALPGPHSNLLYASAFHPAFDARAIHEEAQHWNQRHALPLAVEIRPHPIDRTPNRRLRIGYVSPDFRDHCQTFFTLPLLSNHDHLSFEIFCYSHSARTDARTIRLQSCANVWRSTLGLSDRQYAELIRQDQIDILIDLTMHMQQGRPLVFARKPAPIQIAWLAYPGTTGLTTIDYRLSDPHLDPPGHFDSFYSEKTLRLPDSFWCYDPLTTQPSVNPLPALSTASKGTPHLTFGCLNNPCKLNDATLQLWAKVLHAIPHSRLLLLVAAPSHRRHVLTVFQQAGITSDRIEFLPYQPRDQYLALYHRIDLALDTFPYNGHTTSLDAYWMGVPVITLVGNTVVGRAGLSQLTNLNLPELIAHTPDQFVQIATTLANDLPCLASLRSTLRERMQKSPLMDAPKFTRAIESTYRQIWHDYCNTTP